MADMHSKPTTDTKTQGHVQQHEDDGSNESKLHAASEEFFAFFFFFLPLYPVPLSLFLAISLLNFPRHHILKEVSCHSLSTPKQ